MTAGAKCPKCGMMQMARPTCKSCGAVLPSPATPLPPAPAHLIVRPRETRLASGACMRTRQGDIATSGPSRRVIVSALLVGGLAGAAGFFGPPFFFDSHSTSIFGFVLGFFITGPVGALAGALWGIVRCAKNANEPETRAILRWLSAIWVLTLLYTRFMFGLLDTQAVLPAIGLQGLIVGSSAFLLYRGDTRTRLSRSVRRCRPVAVTMLSLIMVMTVFPPITTHWMGSSFLHESADSTAPLPKVAFILDGRFGSSRQRALFGVDQRTLVLEWVISVVAALGVSLVIIRVHGRSRPDIGPPGAA